MCCLEENKLSKTWVEGGVAPVSETLSALKHCLALVHACTRTNAIRNGDLGFLPSSAGSFLKIVFLRSNHLYVRMFVCQN